MGDDIWSVRRLASRCGIPETSVRRMIGELEANGITITDWRLDKAVMAIRAYRDGHSPKAISALGALPYVGTQSWLVSGAAPGTAAEVFSTLLQATAFIEAHPHTTYHLSPVGFMGQEAV